MITKENILKDYKKSKVNLGIIRTREGQNKFKEEIEEVAKKMVELLKSLSVEQQNFALELTEVYIMMENSNSSRHLNEYKQMMRTILR